MAEIKTVNKGSRKTSAAVSVAQVGEVTLEQIVAATLDANIGFIYTSSAVHGPFVEAGLVEVNPSISNEAGEFATRATEKGVLQVNTVSNTESNAVAAVPAKNSFVLESNIPVPSISGRGRTGTTYPFDAMEVGNSFFVANSEDKPNAAKSLASTVSSATARYAVETGETKLNKAGETVLVVRETRKFIVRSVEENGVKGARIWRTA